MSTVFVLTNRKRMTPDGYRWALGWGRVAHAGDASPWGPGLIRASPDLPLAVLLNPVRDAISGPRAFAADAVIVQAGLTEVGCSRVTPVHELQTPGCAPKYRVKFAVLCAQRVCHRPAFREWAAGWLDGKDRRGTTAQRILTPMIASTGTPPASKSHWFGLQAAIGAAQAAMALSAKETGHSGVLAARAALVAQNAIGPEELALAATLAEERAAGQGARIHTGLGIAPPTWLDPEEPERPFDIVALAHQACGVWI